MEQTPPEKIDIAEIARGRRITAVTASELKLTPRKADRPKPASGLKKLSQKMMQKALRKGT